MISADAPGTYANGIGTNLDIIDRVGEAALSTSNSQSYNMIPSDISPYVPAYVGDQISNNFSMSFDGTNYIDVDTLSSEISSNTNGTFSLWINLNDATPTAANTPIYVGNKNADTRLYINCNTDGTCSALLRHSNTTNFILQTTQAVFSDNTWHNIVLTQNGIEPVIYIDGAIPAQSFNISTDKTQWINNLPSVNSVRLGHLMLNGSSLQNFNGSIDEVAFWNIALNAGQIYNDIYQPTATATNKTADLANNPNLPNPVAWYRMGD